MAFKDDAVFLFLFGNHYIRQHDQPYAEYYLYVVGGARFLGINGILHHGQGIGGWLGTRMTLVWK